MRTKFEQYKGVCEAKIIYISALNYFIARVSESRQPTISPCFLLIKENKKTTLKKHFFPFFSTSYFSSIISTSSLLSLLSVSCRLLCDGVIIEDAAPVFNAG